MEPIFHSLMQPYAKLTDAYRRIDVKESLRAKLFIDALVPVSKIPNDDIVLQQRGLGYLLFVLPVLLKSTARKNKVAFDDIGKHLLDADALTCLPYHEMSRWIAIEDAERVTINVIHNDWRSSTRNLFVALDTMTIGKRHSPAVARAANAFACAKDLVTRISEQVINLHYLNDEYLVTCSIEAIRNQVEILTLLVTKDSSVWKEHIKTADEDSEYIDRLYKDYEQIVTLPSIFESALIMLEQREYYFPNDIANAKKITEYLTII